MTAFVVILIVVLILVLGLVFEYKVQTLLNNPEYFQIFDARVQISDIPRKSIDGYVSRLLEMIKYLSDREDILPFDIPSFTYNVSHIGLEAKQKSGFNLSLFGRLFWFLLLKSMTIAIVIGGLLWIIVYYDSIICTLTHISAGSITFEIFVNCFKCN